MTKPLANEIAKEIEQLLTAAFAPTRLAVINDSARHTAIRVTTALANRISP